MIFIKYVIICVGIVDRNYIDMFYDNLINPRYERINNYERFENNFKGFYP